MRNKPVFYIIFFTFLNLMNDCYSQQAGLRISLLSQEDSSIVTGKALNLYKLHENNSILLVTNQVVDSISEVFYVNNSGDYLFCFSSSSEGCFNKFEGEQCFEYSLKKGEVIADTLWAPLIMQVISFPSTKNYFLYYASRKLCHGYIKTYFVNTTGSISYEGRFKHGIPRGIHIGYYQDGSICHKITYSKHGKIEEAIYK